MHRVVVCAAGIASVELEGERMEGVSVGVGVGGGGGGGVGVGGGGGDDDDADNVMTMMRAEHVLTSSSLTPTRSST